MGSVGPVAEQETAMGSFRSFLQYVVRVEGDSLRWLKQGPGLWKNKERVYLFQLTIGAQPDAQRTNVCSGWEMW